MLGVIFLLLLISYWTYHLWWKRRHLPPGPVPLPLLGNILQLSQFSSTEAAYIAWRKQYGDTFTFWLGDRPVVGVCNYDHMVEYFQKQGDKYDDRPPDGELMKYATGFHNGIVYQNGPLWKNQRRFALNMLRDFGLGKGLMEERVMVECDDMLKSLEEEKARGVQEHQITAEIDRAIGSLINSVIFGYRYNKENIVEFEDLKNRALESIHALGQPPVMMCRHKPHFYKNVPIIGKYLKLLRTAGHHMMDFFVERIEEHKKDLQDEDMETLQPRDLVAAFLKEKARLDSLNEPHFFSFEQLNGFCFDIWITGQETTSNTLGWGVAYLILNPPVQKKIHKELDEVIGTDRPINIADRANLNYIQAVCHEVQRLANLVPTNVIHATSQDVVFEGYHLPKGTAITPLISVLLYYEKLFPEPQKFIPERFLDQEGKVQKPKEHLPFSIGRRQCLGENLARMEIFLFIANLMNKYHLLPGKEAPDPTRTHGFTAHIKDYNCKIVPRQRS